MTFVPPSRRDFFLQLQQVACQQMAAGLVIFGERFSGRLKNQCRGTVISTKNNDGRKTEHNSRDKTFRSGH